MKYYGIILITLLAAGCKKRGAITFNVTATGVKNGVFIVKTLGDSTIYGENIKDGKFPEKKYFLKEPGYYSMNVTDEDNNDNHEPFEVYLESGTYTVKVEAGKLNHYPVITSPSKIQQQLSAFYTIADNQDASIHQEITQLNARLKAKGNSMSKGDFANLLGKISLDENKLLQSNVTAFKAFLKQYPQADISTHLMQKLNYADDPVSYNAIYQTLTPAAKNSDDGKEIGEKLSHLIKLVAGAQAPRIEGKMPDGKPFDPKSIHKKLILVDFWRAANDFSRQNHKKLTTLLTDINDPKRFGILSVSLDSKPDWWTTAIKEDNMNWPQVSDLKGDDSPNAANWSIDTIPTYYLLDENWNIVARNLDIGNIDFEVRGYLAKIK